MWLSYMYAKLNDRVLLLEADLSSYRKEDLIYPDYDKVQQYM